MEENKMIIYTSIDGQTRIDVREEEAIKNIKVI